MKASKRIVGSGYIFIILSIVLSCYDSNGQPRILIFTRTNGFHHVSIPAGRNALLNMAAENGWKADTTSDAFCFKEDMLRKYSAVVFLSTTGNLFNNEQQKAFEHYIQRGGGYVGIHAASDAEYDWDWYGSLVGGYFKNHPRPQKAIFDVINHDHPATDSLPDRFSYEDEWYNFKNLSTAIKPLIMINENSYTGGENGTYHPMTWYHEFDGGRSFYTGFGHSDEAFFDPLILKQIQGGIEYAIGKLNEPN